VGGHQEERRLWNPGKPHPYLEKVFIFCQHLREPKFLHVTIEVKSVNETRGLS